MDELEQIKQKLNVVDVISEYLTLKKAGVNYKANCPFHGENTPSFMVSPERGIWHCFGCQKGGDIFRFVMEKEGLEFKDALEILAQKAGVTLKKQKREVSLKDRLIEIHEKAQQFYSYLLLEHKVGKEALEYLHKRGLTDQTIKEFGIGYAPQNWTTLTNFLRKRGYKVEELIASGLCVESKNGCYDRFRGRIMFPLIDVRKKVIGFSGRVLGKGEPKYINSPQTTLFDKRNFLLGLHLAKGDIKQKNEAIIVEGEMDMIMSYQSGVKNIVASKGTALTTEHIEQLKKYTDTLNLCFDMDLAGDNAARRGIEMADSAGMNMKVISLSGEGVKDPAEICLQDPEIWKDRVKNAIPIYDYYLESVSKRFNLKNAADKRQIFDQLIPIWQKISDPITRAHYTQKLAALLQVKEEMIRKHMDKKEVYKAPTIQTPVKQVEKVVYDRRNLLENYLIALLLHIPIDHTYVPNFPETLLTQESLKQIYVFVFIFLDTVSFKGKAFKIGEFIKTLPPELVSKVDELYLMEVDERVLDKEHWQKEVNSVITELKKMLIKTSLEKLSLQIKNAQEFNQVENLALLSKRFRDLSVKLKNL